MSDTTGPEGNEPESTIDVEFYWRPGCGFCMMLDRSLAKHGITMHKHNIWEDPAHAAVVREWAEATRPCRPW
ncbi:MAG: glutaredoxin domain-containing protein [Acidimicrobiales bacterium]